MAKKLLTRILLATLLTTSAVVVGGAAGAAAGSRLVDAADELEAVANAIAGMTLGCGVCAAVATYLSTHLPIRKLRRLALSCAFVASVVLVALFVWDRSRGSRLFDRPGPAVPVHSHTASPS